MDRKSLARFVVTGAAIVLVALVAVVVQQPNVQATIGVTAIAAGILITILGARQPAGQTSCSQCDASEDWGLGFCHQCGHGKASD